MTEDEYTIEYRQVAGGTASLLFTWRCILSHWPTGYVFVADAATMPLAKQQVLQELAAEVDIEA